jgi:hypothetical protein
MSLVSGIVARPRSYSHGALEHLSEFSETTNCSHFRNDFGCWNFLYPKSALNLIATLPM